MTCRKAVLLLMAACLLLACAASAFADSAWLAVTTSQRISSRSGPGTQYDETGSYHKAGVQVYALTKAWDSRNSRWWVQVELTYSGKQRRVYTGEQRLYVDLDLLPEETVIGYGSTTKQTSAYFGPGTNYSGMKDGVPAGRNCTVYQNENQYVQIEYQLLDGSLRRAWIKESAFSWSSRSSQSGSTQPQPSTGNGLYMVSDTTYAKIRLDRNIFPFTSSSLTTRGNVWGASSSAVIHAGDDMYIMEAADDWVRVTYPQNGSRVGAYVYLYDLTTNNAQHQVRTTTRKFYFAQYATSALDTDFCVAKGDVMVVLAEYGDRLQVVYPVSNGCYRIAWCNKSDFYSNSK